MKDTLTTYYSALRYLALHAHSEAEKTPDEETRCRLYRKETQHWTTYALSCAHIAGSLFEEQAKLMSNGEMALRKTISRCIHLRDLEKATSVYQEFKDLVENDGDAWEPEVKTKRLWQKALTLEEMQVA